MQMAGMIFQIRLRHETQQKGVWSMANIIDDKTIEYVGILAKLELSEEDPAIFSSQ